MRLPSGTFRWDSTYLLKVLRPAGGQPPKEDPSPAKNAGNAITSALIVPRLPVSQTPRGKNTGTSQKTRVRGASEQVSQRFFSLHGTRERILRKISAPEPRLPS